MKRKALIIGGIAVGVLACLVILVWPAAPLWAPRLGVKPVCIQGDLPHLRVVSCPQIGNSPPAVTPTPLPTLEAQAPIPLIVDDDGSPDGVTALLFFLRNPLYKVEAVTVSAGEAHPEVFAPHIVRLLAAVGRPDLPVGFGRAAPLGGNNAFPEPWRQTSDAFWDIPLPAATASAEPLPAARLIVETLNRSPQPVAVFVSGPHTNLAEALRLDPGIRKHIRVVYMMGGSIYLPGNIESDWPEIHNSTAEWNIWADPVAADEVFASGFPLRVMPLDGTSRVTWTQSDAQDWAASGTAEGALAAKLLSWMLRSWSTDRAYIWDLAAAAAMTDPRLCLEAPLALSVVVEAGPEQGRTVVEDHSPNAQVCLEPDAGQIKARVADALAK
jgi:inosine-uridine nucleoside N-ribohydrolase